MYCARARNFGVDQLLDRLAVAQPVGDRSDVIHAIDVGIEHRVGAVLGNLFHAAMQVADDALGAQNFFAVELEDDAQHAVRRRMLRSHVEDHSVRQERFCPWYRGRDSRLTPGPLWPGFAWSDNRFAINRSLSTLDAQVDLHPLLVLLQDRVILAQRMALPVIRHQDALQVGMSVERRCRTCRKLRAPASWPSARCRTRCAGARRL